MAIKHHFPSEADAAGQALVGGFAPVGVETGGAATGLAGLDLKAFVAERREASGG
ncbi:MAG TPA: hypothetical protein VH186_07690 [Chloroflexia bacterium]|nr:hypothetical protein [Chloroflexia bacterium]